MTGYDPEKVMGRIARNRVIVAGTPAASFVGAAAPILRAEGVEIQTALRMPSFYVQVPGEQEVPQWWLQQMALRFAEGNPYVCSKMRSFGDPATSINELAKLLWRLRGVAGRKGTDHGR